MPNRSRVSIAIRADIHQAIKDEAERRGLSVARLAEIILATGLTRLPEIPDEELLVNGDSPA